MSASFRSGGKDLVESVKEFAGEYVFQGGMVKSADQHGNSIRVIVDSMDVADKLPVSFNGHNVAVFLDRGRAGLKLLLRDRSGQVQNP